MSEAKGGLRIVAAPASGWCEADTGVCHIDTADEAPTVEASNENAGGLCPTLRSDEQHRRVSLPTR